MYEKLDRLIALAYKEIKLDILTVTGDVELSASYTLTEDSVSYSVEKMNTFSLDGNLSGVSPEYKKLYTGTGKVSDGKVTELDGDPVALPSYDELTGGFSFDEKHFKNAKTEDGSFSADVASPDGFYGSPVSADNMTVDVRYSDYAIGTITITYRTANSTVTAIYTFTA